MNLFLYNRKGFFNEYKKSLFDTIDEIFNNKKTIDILNLKKKIVKNIYTFYLNMIKNISILDDLFKIAPKINNEIIVYRGINFIDQKLEQAMVSKLRSLKKGDTYSFENFLSTSLLNNAALDFLQSHFVDVKEAKCCLFKINVPKHTRILYLDSDYFGFKTLFSNNKINLYSEYEVLLPRSCLLKFIKSYTISGKIPYSCSIENIKKKRTIRYTCL